MATAVVTSGLTEVALSVADNAVALERILMETSASDLRREIRQQLADQGFSEDLVNLFIRNEHLSPRQQLFITAALIVMEGVEDREVLIRRAAGADFPAEGYDRQIEIEMAALIHNRDTPFSRFVDLGYNRAIAVTKGGNVVLFALSDYLTWTENLDLLMQGKNERIEELGIEGSRRLWLTGEVSERATEGLEKLGWSVRPGLLGDFAASLCNPEVPSISLGGK